MFYFSAYMFHETRSLNMFSFPGIYLIQVLLLSKYSIHIFAVRWNWQRNHLHINIEGFAKLGWCKKQGFSNSCLSNVNFSSHSNDQKYFMSTFNKQYKHADFSEKFLVNLCRYDARPKKNLNSLVHFKQGKLITSSVLLFSILADYVDISSINIWHLDKLMSKVENFFSKATSWCKCSESFHSKIQSS